MAKEQVISMTKCKECGKSFLYRNTIYCDKELCFNCSKKEKWYGVNPYG